MHVWQKDNLNQAFEAMFWLASMPISVRESISSVNLEKICQVLPKLRQHISDPNYLCDLFHFLNTEKWERESKGESESETEKKMFCPEKKSIVFESFL